MSENFSRHIRLSTSPPVFSPYPCNKLNFSEFAWSNLIPKSIFLQFMSPSMVYFLIILIIELISVHKSDYSNSTLTVFLVLISINVLKNGVILVSELKEETKINKEQVEIWNGKSFELVTNESLLVGNIVKIYDNQRCPADVLVLFSSNTDGVFYSDLESVV